MSRLDRGPQVRFDDGNSGYIAGVLGCRPIRDEEPAIRSDAPTVPPRKRLVLAALLGGVLLGAPYVLLNNQSARLPRVMADRSVQPNAAGRTNNGMALTSSVAPATTPASSVTHASSVASVTTRPDLENESTVTVNPGMTLRDVAREVGTLPGHSESSFIDAADSGVVHSFYVPLASRNLEGVLGTGTYTIAPGESDATILYEMVLRFTDQARQAGLSFDSASRRGYSVYQILTVASIVQQEGYIAKNMPDVARVIYNRLATNRPLQMNSTVLYPLGQDGGAFTTADLHVESPYNTYLHTGLPPTPICSPSLTALKAAVNPPAGNWLFFNVVRADGTEAFSSTFTQQLANEKLANSLGIG